jgi:predicted phosphodiesterase
MLVVTDLHLTDRSRDEYRWEIFKQLTSHEDVSCLSILGDLTDHKDGHSAVLVNRIIDTLMDLPFKTIYIIKGNHDYADEMLPFFRFLQRQDVCSKIRFMTEPTWQGQNLYLPHTKTPKETWDKIDMRAAKAIFCHQTFDGADAGRGMMLNGGISSRYFSNRGITANIYSGDIHVRQKCGDVLYVGCPYPIAFGDTFKGRYLLLNEDGTIKANYKGLSIQKLSLSIFSPDELAEMCNDGSIADGDQLKLRLRLYRKDYGSWEKYRDEIKAICEEKGILLHSLELEAREQTEEVTTKKAQKGINRLSPDRVLQNFVAAREIEDDFYDFGAEIVKSVTSDLTRKGR